MILLIDNYDSFAYNIYQYIIHFNHDVKVITNRHPLSEIKGLKNIDAIVISPGPSRPEHSMLSLDAIDFYKGKLPILGVCLGMQAISYYFGANIRKAKQIMHGKVDKIRHLQSRIFKGLPEKIDVVRYHSLAVDNLKDLNKTAYSIKDSEIMAVESEKLKIYGLQFHPESYLTQNGLDIIKNFMEVVYAK